MDYIFNRNEVKKQESPKYFFAQDEVENTPGLFRASLDDALLYGGDAVRKALSTIELIGDKKFVSVDVKVHMLMPGMIPAIPGWHTDGIPRNPDGSPSGSMLPYCPNMDGLSSPHFHLFVAGDCSPTQFLSQRSIGLEVPDEPTNDLYSAINEQVADLTILKREDIPEGVWWGWDWFELHRAQPAIKRGWRMLIRVTESDFLAPEDDLRRVLRTQQQAYLASESFGW